MSTISAALLRTIHRLHSQLTDLRGRLERGPRQVKAHQASVAKLEEDLATAENLVKESRLAADRKQLDIKDQEAKIDKWGVQLNSAASNQEFKALQEQIEAGKMAASVLEDETLELLGRIDEFEQGVEQAKQNLKSGQEELAKVKLHVESTADTLRTEIARLEEDLVGSEKDLSGDVRADYERVVRQKGADGLSPVEDGVCEGCGNQLTLNMQADLALSKAVFCKSCGSLLYLPE